MKTAAIAITAISLAALVLGASPAQAAPAQDVLALVQNCLAGKADVAFAGAMIWDLYVGTVHVTDPPVAVGYLYTGHSYTCADGTTACKIDVADTSSVIITNNLAIANYKSALGFIGSGSCSASADLLTGSWSFASDGYLSDTYLHGHSI